MATSPSSTIAAIAPHITIGSRGLAWYNASRIVDPASSEDARQSTARSVQEFVREVMSSPVWTTRAVLKIGRLIVGMTRRWPTNPDITT